VNEVAGYGLPERLDTVLLDAGGVLLDLDYGYLARLIDARGISVTEDELSFFEALARTEIERMVRNGGKTSEAWRDYFRLILGTAKVPVAIHEEIIDSLWEAHQRIGMWTVAIPGGPETVAELGRLGYRVGVVSNAEGRVERDLYSAGYDGLLQTVVDSHVVGVEKPDPEIFRIALTRLGSRAERAVYVGDVPSVDVEGARAAGIAPILLDRHDLYPEVNAPRLRSIRELPVLLAPER
jgi:putative hydrolase of the HAD superfamily